MQFAIFAETTLRRRTQLWQVIKIASKMRVYYALEEANLQTAPKKLSRREMLHGLATSYHLLADG